MHFVRGGLLFCIFKLGFGKLLNGKLHVGINDKRQHLCNSALIYTQFSRKTPLENLPVRQWENPGSQPCFPPFLHGFGSCQTQPFPQDTTSCGTTCSSARGMELDEHPGLFQPKPAWGSMEQDFRRCLPARQEQLHQTAHKQS